jgi:glycosyltransferase involved in cell wall biosynthesis
MNRTSPLTVTVVMALLDGEPHLGECLAAIDAQTRPPHQVVIVDGGSTDGSRERVAAWGRATVLDIPNAGWHRALNAAAGVATGDLVAVTSSDDRLDRRALERHTDALAAAPEAGYSYGRVALFADAGGVSDSVPEALDGTTPSARVLEALAIRRSVLDRVGGFRPDLRHSADVEWVARLGDLGIVPAVIDEVVVAKRLHTANTTYTQPDVTAGITRSLRLSILRKQGRA